MTRAAAVGRVALVVGGMALAVPVVVAGVAGPRHGRTRRASVAVQMASRIMLRAMGIRLRREGSVRDGAALVVANHVSWLDVLVIAAMAPVVPVVDLEVAHRPLIGGLARHTGTIFVRRRAGRDLPDAVARMTATLRRGHRVLVFPEGSTTRGGPPGDFHRAGFQAAVDAAAVIAPVSIEYLDRRGEPAASPPFVGDDTLPASVWRVLLAGPMLAHVRWRPAVPAIEDGGHRAGHRARAATLAHGRISRSLLGGREAVDVASISHPVSAISESEDGAASLDASGRVSSGDRGSQ